eukprot:721322_1
MSPIGEDIETDVKHVGIQHIIQHKISPRKESSGRKESVESEEVSGLLVSKNIRTSHSMSIDFNDELVDFTGIIVPHSKYLSSPSGITPCAPARQSSKINKSEQETFIETMQINIGKMGSVKRHKSESDSKEEYNYKLESDDLLLTLTMLINSGLVKQENAMHLKSLRRVQLREIRRKKHKQEENELKIKKNNNG